MILCKCFSGRSHSQVKVQLSVSKVDGNFVLNWCESLESSAQSRPRSSKNVQSVPPSSQNPLVKNLTGRYLLTVRANLVFSLTLLCGNNWFSLFASSQSWYWKIKRVLPKFEKPKCFPSISMMLWKISDPCKNVLENINFRRCNVYQNGNCTCLLYNNYYILPGHYTSIRSVVAVENRWEHFFYSSKVKLCKYT